MPARSATGSATSLAATATVAPLAAQLVGKLVEAVVAPGDQPDRRALAGESPSDREPEPGPGGDDDHYVGVEGGGES